MKNNSKVDRRIVLEALIRHETLTTGNIEKLFELCRWNKPFRAQLEHYLTEKLSS